METTRRGSDGGPRIGMGPNAQALRSGTVGVSPGFHNARALVVVVVVAVVVGVVARVEFGGAGSDVVAPAEFAAFADGRAWLDGKKLDLNAVDARTLARISGIGPSLAQRIVDERGRRGRFSEVEELDEVEGIGPKMLEKLTALVEVR